MGTEFSLRAAVATQHWRSGRHCSEHPMPTDPVEHAPKGNLK